MEESSPPCFAPISIPSTLSCHLLSTLHHPPFPLQHAYPPPPHPPPRAPHPPRVVGTSSPPPPYPAHKRPPPPRLCLAVSQRFPCGITRATFPFAATISHHRPTSCHLPLSAHNHATLLSSPPTATATATTTTTTTTTTTFPYECTRVGVSFGVCHPLRRSHHLARRCTLPQHQLHDAPRATSLVEPTTRVKPRASWRPSRPLRSTDRARRVPPATTVSLRCPARRATLQPFHPHLTTPATTHHTTTTATTLPQVTHPPANPRNLPCSTSTSARNCGHHDHARQPNTRRHV